MIRIGAMVSGGGTNLQAVLDAIDAGKIDGQVVTVVSSKEGAYAIERAAKHNIPSVVISKKDYPNGGFEKALIDHFKSMNVDLIILAGYMTILGEEFIKAFENKIMNIHPALIPSFCGDGFYGLRVHEKALEYGVKVSGATIHFVNEKADAGAIILQGTVDVANDETPESLQKKIMENVEWKLLPKAVSLFCEDRISIKDGKAYVDLKD